METLPRSSELVEPVVKILQGAMKPLSNSEIEKEICNLLQIPVNLQELIHSGSRTELQYRLAWARTKAKNLGLISRQNKTFWQSTGRSLS